MLKRAFKSLALVGLLAFGPAAPVLAQGSSTYTYDALGRLETSTTAQGSTTYTYDKADNRTSVVSCVSGCNRPPAAATDNVTAGNGATIQILALANDSDPDSNPIKITSVGATTLGTATVAAGGGSITYTATAGKAGKDTFKYTIADSLGLTATGIINVTVNPLPPVAGPVSVTVAYGSSGNAVPLNITGGAASNILIGTAPANGTTAITGVTLTYSPKPTFSGKDTFTYIAQNVSGTSQPGLVTVTVGAAAAPTVSALSMNVNANSSATGTLLPAGAWTSLAVSTAPTKGTVTISGTTATYTANSGASGTDTFKYTATGPGGTSAPGTVTVNIISGPIAISWPSIQAYFTGPDGSYSKNTIATVTGGSGKFTYTWTAKWGSIGPTPPGLLTYTGTSGTVQVSKVLTAGPANPDPNYGLTVKDNITGLTASATSTVDWKLTAPPAVPIAGPVSATVAYNSTNTAITLALNGGAATSVAVSTPAAHGVATATGTTIKYTPTTGYYGPDTFSYTASNASGVSTPGLATITVGLPPPPSATSAAASVAFNSKSNPVPITLSGGPATSLLIGTQPTHGLAEVSGMAITYTPTPGYSGTDTFTYMANGPGGTSNAAPVTITVRAKTLVISWPTIQAYFTGPNGSYSATTIATVTGGSGNYTYNWTTKWGFIGPNPPGLLTYTGTSGSVLVSKVLAAGPSNPDSNYGVSVKDNVSGEIATATGTVDWKLTAPPTPPVVGAVSATIANNAVNTPITLSFTGGGAATSVAVAGQASHGVATASGTSITYTPTNGYFGPDSFTYTASNSGGTSAAATVTITVNPAPLTISWPPIQAYFTGPDGQYTATTTASVTGGSGNYTYSWTTLLGYIGPNGSTSYTGTSGSVPVTKYLAAGPSNPDPNYSLTVRDNVTGQTATATTTVDWKLSRAPLTVTWPGIDAFFTGAEGPKTASTTAYAQGGSGNYTFSWSAIHGGIGPYPPEQKTYVGNSGTVQVTSYLANGPAIFNPYYFLTVTDNVTGESVSTSSYVNWKLN